jgi:lipopolysaccharide export system protein LptA
MQIKPLRAALAALFALAALPVAAQITGIVPSGTGQQPIEIEAEKGVEWRQKDEVYVARGNAVAKRGDSSVKADTLTAHYKKGADNKQEIWKVVAEGNVLIKTAKETLTGQRAEYVVETGVFIVTGNNLKMDNGKQTVTASERFEYNSKTKIVMAVGNAVVVEDKRRVRADRFIAHMKDDGQGKNSLKRVEAIGGVVITTPGEVARGDRGDYDAEKEIATLTGNVKLTRGDYQLNGERAEVNMKTGVSRLVADESGKKGPVRVLLPVREGEGGKGPLENIAPTPDNNPKKSQKK